MKQLSTVLIFLFLCLPGGRLLAQDAGVTALLNPGNEVCGQTSHFFTVIVKNYGSSTLTNIPVGISVSGNSTFTASGSVASLAAGKTDTLTFSSGMNTVSGGNFTFKAYTSVSGDVQKSNDTTTKSIVINACSKNPLAKNVNSCSPGVISLGAPSQTSGSKTYWYPDATTRLAVHRGDTLTKSFTKSAIYYVLSTKNDSLTTTYAAGNGQQGIMFDVGFFKTLNVDSFYVNIQNSSSDTVEVYYRLGSYSGYQGTATAWTLLGKDYVKAAGSGNATHVRVGGIKGYKGDTIAFYIRLQTNTDIRYTNGSDTAKNSDIYIYPGNGIAGSYGQAFSPRRFNGSVWYSECPSDKIKLQLDLGLTGSQITANSLYKGQINKGTVAAPDEACPGDSLMYEIGAPKYTTLAGYGSSWTINSFKFATASGKAAVNYTMGQANSNSPVKIKFFPKSSEQDSTYILTFKVYNSITGCDTTYLRYIHVSKQVTASFTTSNVCDEVNASFTNTSTSGTGINYLWLFGDKSQGTSKSPIHLYAAPGKYDVTLYTFSGSCIDSAKKTVEVYPSATTVKSLQGSPYNGSFNSGTVSAPDEVCAGDTVTYEVSPPAGLKNSDFGSAWYISKLTFNTVKGTANKDTMTSITNGVNNSYFRFIPSKAFSDSTLVLSVEIQTSNGCKATINRYILVHPLPTAKFSYSGTCFGQITSFVNQSSISSGSISKYEWNFGDGNTSTSTSQVVNHRYSSPGQYTVKLRGISSYGCAGAEVQQTISVFPSVLTASVDIGSPYQGKYMQGTTFSPDEVCVGDTVTYELIPATGLGNSNFGTDWVITQSSFRTINGTISTDTAFIRTSGGKNNQFRFFPSASFSDSSIRFDVTIYGKLAGCDTTFTRYIAVRPKPNVVFTSANYCLGQKAVFTNTSTISSGTVSSYQWDFGDGIVRLNSASKVEHQYTKAGTYNVKLTAISSYGCKTSLIKQVQMFDLPEARFITGTSCQGVAVNFTDQSLANGAGGLSHIWYFGNGDSSTKQNPVYYYPKAGKYDVKLVVKNANGCADTLTRQITINASPKAAFNYVNACVGKNVNFANQSTNPVGGTPAYIWDFGDGSTSNAASPSHRFVTKGTYTVKLIITSSTGCTDTTSQVITPFAPPTMALTSADHCEGNSTAIKDTTTYQPGTIYVWSFGDGSSPVTLASGNISHQYATSGTYKVKLVKTNPGGCTDSAFLPVTITPVPVAAFTASDGCVGEQLNFANQSSISAGNMTYSWDFGDGATSTDRSPNHAYSTDGAYNIKLTAIGDSGCTHTVTRDITIFALPALGKWTVKTTDLEATFTPSGTFSKYFWEFGDGDTSSATSPKHIYAQPGKYNVKLTVTNSNNCTASLTDSLQIGRSGIAGTGSVQEDVKVYPNPFSYATQIAYTLHKPAMVLARVYDVNGKLICTLQDGQQMQGRQLLTFNSHDHGLSSGIYFLRLSMGDEVHNLRIVKTE